MEPALPPRLAKNHRLVYEIVSEQGRGKHLSMNEVHALASERRPGIGFTTVYRALGRLRDAGMVSEILLPGAEAAYYEPAGETHAHFRCDRCGRVEDIAYAMPPEIAEELASRHDVAIDSAQISLHGLCSNCRG